ncbi:hypothetical protein KBC55_04440 [Patescibacteria group bacterium]|nr:hypothetical protein [Patescibacteria group bacterium]
MRPSLGNVLFFSAIGCVTIGIIIVTLFAFSPRGKKFLERRLDDRSSFLNSEGDTAQEMNDATSAPLVETENGDLAPEHPPTVLQKYTVVNADDRFAVCNDGSPATYYFAPGTEENNDKWVVYLKGGGSCINEADCLDRAANNDPGLVSSNNYPNGLKEDGILSADPAINPDFYNWNRVHVRYCSSDLWIGDTENMVGEELWQFRGKNIVAAVIEDLQNAEIIKTKTLAEASELLFVGSSAGGAGVTQNLDDVARMLPNVQVRGVADSSAQVSYEAYDEAYVENLRNADPSFQNRQFDESCTASLEDGVVNNCVLLNVSYQHIATPIYYYIDQFDRNRLSNQVSFPLNQNERAWVQGYAETLLNFLPNLDGYFVPNKTWHTALTNERFTIETIDGVSFQEALHNWYFGEGTYNYIAE